MADLGGMQIKLARAQSYIAELSEKWNAYRKAKSLDVESRIESNGDRVFFVRFRSPIPLEWAGIVGDAVHNMRTALDYLAWQFVKANGGSPSRDTCFPFGPAPPDYEAVLERGLAGASPEALKFVRRLRPFKGGNGLLTRLHALDIEDKHKLLLLVGAAHSSVIFRTRMRVPWQKDPVVFPAIALKPKERQFPLKDGDVVFVQMASAQVEDQSEFGIELVLAFGQIAEVEGLALLETLKSIHSYITKVMSISIRQIF